MQAHGISNIVLDQLREGCLLIAPDWRFLSINATAAQQLRRSRSEVLGRSLPDLFPAIVNTPLFATLTRCMTARQATDIGHPFTFEDGKTAFFEFRILPVPEGLLVLSLDITATQEREQQLTRFFTLSPDLMVVAGFDGRFRHLSPSWERTLGYSLDELTASPWLDYVHPDDWQATAEAAERLMRGDKIELFVNRYRGRDGSWHWIEWHCTPDINQQLIYAVARDISERRSADAALSNLALFPEENPSPVLRIDCNGTLQYHNRASEPLLASWHCAVGDRVPDVAQAAVSAACLHGDLREFELPCEQRVLSFIAAPIPGRDYVHLYGRDITDRVRAKEALRSNLKRFELLAWTAEELLKSPEPQLVVETLYHKVMEILGCDAFFNYLLVRPAGRLHLNAVAGIPEDVAQSIEWLDFGQAVCGCVARDGCRIVAEHIADSDDERTALVRSFGIRAYACHPLTETNGEIIGTLSFGTRSRDTFSEEDLSLMKTVANQVSIAMVRIAEDAAMRDSEARLRRAEAAAHLGHWRLLLGNGAILWSDELYRILGVERDSFATTLEDCLGLIHPDDQDDVQHACDRLLQHGSETFEFRIVRPDGTTRHVAGYGEIERDRAGRGVALFGTVQDVTDILQKEKELQMKNAEVERFAYTVSHDLRSPLVTVKTFLDCLEQDLLDNNPARIEKDIYFMRTATVKMSRLLDELLEMTRIGRVVSHPEQITFHELIENAQALVSGRVLERGVQFAIKGLPIVLYGDRSRLVEIWQNLLENAVKFLGEQSVPLIEIGAEAQGKETVFFVRDNGIGIDPRFQGKIFGLFEKLEARSEGTGLGLALVKRIVEMYDGRIWVESAGVGQGTTFRFTLPRAIVRSSKGGAA